MASKEEKQILDLLESIKNVQTAQANDLRNKLETELTNIRQGQDKTADKLEKAVEQISAAVEEQKTVIEEQKKVIEEQQKEATSFRQLANKMYQGATGAGGAAFDKMFPTLGKYISNLGDFIDRKSKKDDDQSEKDRQDQKRDTENTQTFMQDIQFELEEANGYLRSIDEKLDRFIKDASKVNKGENNGDGNSVAETLLEAYGIKKLLQGLGALATPVAGLIGSIGLLGTAFTLFSTKVMKDTPGGKQLAEETQKDTEERGFSMLGATAPDAALASNILHPSYEGATPEETERNRLKMLSDQERAQKAMEDQSFMMRIYGVGSAEFLRKKGFETDGLGNRKYNPDKVFEEDREANRLNAFRGISKSAADATPAAPPPAATPPTPTTDDPAKLLTKQRMREEKKETQRESNVAQDLAIKMGMSPDNVQAKTEGGVPVEINGTPVPDELYTDEQRNKIKAAREMRAGATKFGDNSDLTDRFYSGSLSASDTNRLIRERESEADLPAVGATPQSGLTDGTVKDGFMIPAANEGSGKSIDASLLPGGGIENQLSPLLRQTQEQIESEEDEDNENIIYKSRVLNYDVEELTFDTNNLTFKFSQMDQGEQMSAGGGGGGGGGFTDSGGGGGPPPAGTQITQSTGGGGAGGVGSGFARGGQDVVAGDVTGGGVVPKAAASISDVIKGAPTQGAGAAQKGTAMGSIPQGGFGAAMKDGRNGMLPDSALAPIGQGSLKAQPSAASAFKAMREAAGADGVKLGATDAYRSYAAQVDVKRRKPNLAATPGKSNHGWGLAFDMNFGSDTNSPGYKWMVENAAKFGFKGPLKSPNEPWHWEYVGGGSPMQQDATKVAGASGAGGGVGEGTAPAGSGSGGGGAAATPLQPKEKSVLGSAMGGGGAADKSSSLQTSAPTKGQQIATASTQDVMAQRADKSPTAVTLGGQPAGPTGPNNSGKAVNPNFDQNNVGTVAPPDAMIKDLFGLGA